MDTVRAGDFGMVGDQTISPPLSRLADRGTLFTNTTATAPWTLPSHASLFTGTYPSNHGAHTGHKQLDNSQTTMAEVINDEGYETVAVSNNTWISEEFGFARGFETFYKTWQYVQTETDLGKIAREEEGFDKIKAVSRALSDGNPIINLANTIYGQFFRKTEDDGAKRTNEWIEDWLTSRNDSRPFFLFANYLEPHLEYHPPREHAARFLPGGVSYDKAMSVSQDAWGYIAGNIELSDKELEILRALYQAEISYLGERIDEVREMLVEAGEWENTIFIVTSDHGENIGDHGLMDHQYALYDTLLHVPLFINGGPFEDAENDDLVQLADLPPTILDTLEIEAPEIREQFQGTSFHPDSEGTREFAIAEYMAPQPSIDVLEKRVGNLPNHVLEYDRSLRSIRTDQYKYIRGSDGSKELYDIHSDPVETDDVSGSKQDIIDALDSKLDDWVDSFEQSNPKKEASMNDDTKSRLEDLGYLQ